MSDYSRLSGAVQVLLDLKLSEQFEHPPGQFGGKAARPARRGKPGLSYDMVTL